MLQFLKAFNLIFSGPMHVFALTAIRASSVKQIGMNVGALRVSTAVHVSMASQCTIVVAPKDLAVT